METRQGFFKIFLDKKVKVVAKISQKLLKVENHQTQTCPQAASTSTDKMVGKMERCSQLQI